MYRALQCQVHDGPRVKVPGVGVVTAKTVESGVWIGSARNRSNCPISTRGTRAKLLETLTCAASLLQPTVNDRLDPETQRNHRVRPIALALLVTRELVPPDGYRSDASSGSWRRGDELHPAGALGRAIRSSAVRPLGREEAGVEWLAVAT